MTRNLRCLVMSVPALLLAACAAGPELARYPRAHIDRPYTLPKGVASWQTIVPYSFASDSSGSTIFPPVPLPIFWGTSLSDTVTLHWVPLPLAVSFQLDRTPERLIGITTGLGVGYGSGDIGLVLAPTASLFYRQKLAGSFAAEAGIGADFAYRSKSKEQLWSGNLSLGPRFQVSEVLSLKPDASLEVTHAPFQVLVPGSAPLPPARTATRLPLNLTVDWSVSRQWDLSFVYQFRHIGEPNDLTNHSGSISATHFW